MTHLNASLALYVLEPWAEDGGRTSDRFQEFVTEPDSYSLIYGSFIGLAELAVNVISLHRGDPSQAQTFAEIRKAALNAGADRALVHFLSDVETRTRLVPPTDHAPIPTRPPFTFEADAIFDSICAFSISLVETYAEVSGLDSTEAGLKVFREAVGH